MSCCRAASCRKSAEIILYLHDFLTEARKANRGRETKDDRGDAKKENGWEQKRRQGVNCVGGKKNSRGRAGINLVIKKLHGTILCVCGQEEVGCKSFSFGVYFPLPA